MRRFFLTLPAAALAVGWLAAPPVQAQELKARGSVVSVAGDSITVKVGATDMKFTVDEKTRVEAPGGSTAARAAASAGKAGPKIGELLKAGDAVEVSYTDAGGRHAASIRKVSSPGSGGVPSKTAAGTVTAVSASSLSIEGTGGAGSKFTQTFVIDDKTKVVGPGAGTAATAAGGKAPATAMVGKGDRVNVSFNDSGGSLHATEIRVTTKAK